MIKKIRNISVLFCVVLGCSFQPNYDTNAKLKAIFLYNFTRYFKWPDNMTQGNFLIHIVGKNENLIEQLNKMAATKMKGNQKIEVKTSSTIDLKSTPNMLFLLPESSDFLKEANKQLKGKGTLIITENKGLAKAGATINFVEMDNKQKFEYNKANAIKAGLTPSKDMTDPLAIVVK